MGWMLAGLLGAACGGADPRPSVLLVTIDTLRADHVGAYGAQGVRTPRLDALASESTLYVNAAAPMPLTRPSHFTMFTSRYPREHGVVNNAISLPDEELTLAERLRGAGWRTAAFTSIRILGEGSGVEQGFETIDAPVDALERRAPDVVRAAEAWLAGVGPDEPFFLWVHLFDPHAPYAPPPQWRRGLDPELAAAHPSLGLPDLQAVARVNGGDVPATIAEHARQLYRCEVEFTDSWVGKLLDVLDDSGRRDDTALVLTADHGESFDQGVFFDHADGLFVSTLRVPLMVRWPRAFEPGERIEEQVGVVDIAPTVLEIVGLPVPGSMSGRALQEARGFGDRYVLVQHPLYQPWAAKTRPVRMGDIKSVGGVPVRPVLLHYEKTGVVGRGWKYLSAGDGTELYDLASDPTGAVECSTAHPERAGELAAALEAALERHPLRLIEPELINDELRETLEALGYVH